MENALRAQVFEDLDLSKLELPTIDLRCLFLKNYCFEKFKNTLFTSDFEKGIFL